MREAADLREILLVVELKKKGSAATIGVRDEIKYRLLKVRKTLFETGGYNKTGLWTGSDADFFCIVEGPTWPEDTSYMLVAEDQNPRVGYSWHHRTVETQKKIFREEP